MRIAVKPFKLPFDLIHQIKFISPNIYELSAIAEYFGCKSLIKTNEDIENVLFEPDLIQIIKEASAEITKHVGTCNVITLGSNGVLLSRKSTPECSSFFTTKSNYIAIDQTDIQHRLYKVQKIKNIINVSGAGDSFNSGFITAMINGLREDICISVGVESARIAIKSIGPVPDAYFNKDHKCWHIPASHLII